MALETGTLEDQISGSAKGGGPFLVGLGREDRARARIKLFARDRMAKQPATRRMMKNWRLYWNRHWNKQFGEDPREAKPVIPKTRGASKTRHAHITTNRPQIRAFAYTPQLAEVAQLVTDAVVRVHDRRDILRKWSIAAKHCIVSGTGILKPTWNPKTKDVDVESVSEFSLFVDPEATTHEDAIRMTEAKNISLGKLRMRYHDNPKVLARLDNVRPGVIDQSLTVQVNDVNALQARLIGLYSTGGAAEGGTPEAGREFLGVPDDTVAQEMQGEMVTLMEVYERDENDVLHRVIQVNDVELEDAEEDPFDDDEYPYVIYSWDPELSRFFSSGFPEDAEGLQLLLNKIERQKLQILALTANPVFLVPAESGVDADTIRMAAGAVLTWAGDKPPSWLQGAAPPSELYIQGQTYGNMYDRETGNNDLVQGLKPPGADSGVALNLLAQKATVRIDREAMWIEDSHIRLGKLIWNRIRSFYSDERLLALVRPDSMLAAKLTQDPSLIGSLLKSLRTQADVDFRVEIGANLPANRQANLQIALLLAQSGAFGPVGNPRMVEELLKAAHWPNWEMVFQDVKAMIEAVMKAQEQAAKGQQQQQVSQGAPAQGQPQAA